MAFSQCLNGLFDSIEKGEQNQKKDFCINDNFKWWCWKCNTKAIKRGECVCARALWVEMLHRKTKYKDNPNEKRFNLCVCLCRFEPDAAHTHSHTLRNNTKQDKTENMHKYRLLYIFKPIESENRVLLCCCVCLLCIVHYYPLLYLYDGAISGKHFIVFPKSFLIFSSSFRIALPLVFIWHIIVCNACFLLRNMHTVNSIRKKITQFYI